MKRVFTTTSVLIATLLLFVPGCGSSSDPSQAGTQRRFGVRMARMNLWREAMFRFRRAVDIQPDDAMAHNNLAVAYEANGDFDNALMEYREALRLDRGNQHIQKNYSRFVEFTQRSMKRSGPASLVPTPAATTTTTETTTTTTADAPASPPPPPAPPVPNTTTNPPDGGRR